MRTHESEAFQDRAPWWGGDLQTLRNMTMRRTKPLPGRSRRLVFPMADGTGDQLSGALEEPDTPARGSPLVLLVHGLTGCEDSDYMRESARFHLARGRSVIRLNMRGAGPDKSLARNYYHAGCAADIQRVLEGLDQNLTEDGIVLIGYSLGGNVVLNWLGRFGTFPAVMGAATVSAPIEPEQACERMMEPRNALYHRFLIKRMQRDALGSCVLSPAEREALGRVKTIFDVDDWWVAPRNGFDGAIDYYTRTAGAQFVPKISLPTLILHAENDPWIPPEPYRRLLEGAYPGVEVLLAASGGHLGFHERGHSETWHDRMIDRFISERLERPSSGHLTGDAAVAAQG